MQKPFKLTERQLDAARRDFWRQKQAQADPFDNPLYRALDAMLTERGL